MQNGTAPHGHRYHSEIVQDENGVNALVLGPCTICGQTKEQVEAEREAKAAARPRRQEMTSEAAERFAAGRTRDREERNRHRREDRAATMAGLRRRGNA